MPSSATVSSRISSAYRVAAVAVLAATIAGCASSRVDSTGVTGAVATGTPTPPGLVGTNPIVQGQANTQPVPTTTAVVPTATPTVTTGGLPPATTTVAATTPAPAPTAQSSVHVVRTGDTLYNIAGRYGISVAELAAANGLTQTSNINIGQSLVIPAPGSPAGQGVAPLGTITQTGTTPTTPAQPATTTVANTGTHVVASGETLYSISMMYGVTLSSLAGANGMTTGDIVRVGQQLVIPGGGAVTQPTVTATPQQPPAQPPAQQPTQVAMAPVETDTPAATAPVVEPTPPAQETAAAPTAQPSTNGTSFRWPAQGRIISDFGPKPGGERNDGINISLPVGTQIHAAEAGRVIYAGNGVSGYGNLVLIEHADNWVTAYAHLSEMSVTQGATIQRGQVIGLAGATGAVTASQLHFELRRGTTPVNPLDHLVN